ncbi:MAG: TetR/AcrR family transcriptional regulator [Anaerotardibacter sp.]
MARSQYVSTHETHEQVTREKILDAATRVVNRQGFKQLTVRNICSEAGLSTGSFYNLFDNKDDLVSYYLRKEFTMYKERAEEESADKNALEKCVLAYRFFCKCLVKTGLEFVSSYYGNNTNPNFDFIHRSPDSSVIIDQIGLYLEEGKEQGIIKQDLDIKTQKLRIATIVTGSFFYWCVFKGEFDVCYECDCALQEYLLSLRADDSVAIDLEPLVPTVPFNQL